MDEHQSIVRLKQGDMGGLEELSRKYYLQAVRAAYLVTQDQALAEDTVQTSFINLYKKIGLFDENKDFRPWFLRSVVNNAISACRQQKWFISLNDEDEDEDETARNITLLERLSEADCGLEEDYITEETSQAIWSALRQLTPQQRAAIVLRYYLDLSENEITQHLNRPKSTVKWMLFSARRKLRWLLRPLQDDKHQAEIALQEEKQI